ncbi:MAG: OB-fold nucleic acid binding domain-containing protein [Candidatus Diapherotrites archaeon]|nr:OB-fold nucleic acid binding domain-containing protein [Candidatus Diapherotrites archaeon]
MKEEPTEKIVSEIAKKSGKSEIEVSRLIAEKVEKFSGLLTEQGAAYMVGKALGVGGKAAEYSLISELEEGMRGAELRGEVKAVFPAKEFDKGGKKGKVQSIIIEDESGEIRLSLWNDQVDKYKLTKGSRVEITNAIISTYNEKKQLSLGFNGTITVTKKAEEKFEKLANLRGGLSSVNVAGKLLRRFPAKEFSSGERRGKLCNFQLGDETAILRATAWNEKADEIEKYNEGENIEIINGYTKDGMFGVELHLGYSVEIRVSGMQMPGIKEILKEAIPEKKINELVDNENSSISGKISEISRGNLRYLICGKCGKKIKKMENGVVCESCGEVEPKSRAIISIILEDETGKIKVTLFGEDALKIFGITQQQFEKELAEKEAETICEELNEKLAGERIGAYGYTKENSFSGEREFMVKALL